MIENPWGCKAKPYFHTFHTPFYKKKKIKYKYILNRYKYIYIYKESLKI